MGCIKQVEIQVPARVTAVEVKVPAKIISVEVQVPGLPGPPGPSGVGTEQVILDRFAANILSGHRVVRAVSATQVDIASSGDLTHADTIMGITTGAAASGAPVDVINHGLITESSWAFTPGAFVFVGIHGAITQVAPSLPTSLYQRVIGVAVAPDTIFVDLGPVIELI